MLKLSKFKFFNFKELKFFPILNLKKGKESMEKSEIRKQARQILVFGKMILWINNNGLGVTYVSYDLL